MRLCIYGGSFNPPHVGHAAAIRAAQREANLDEVRVIPAAMPPHKALASGSPDAGERFELFRIAFGDMPGVAVSDLEVRREGKSYTVDTVRALRAENPDAELCLLVGTDMLRTFDEWRDFQTILEQVTLLATARDDDELAGHVTKNSFWHSYNTWSVGMAYKPCIHRGRNHRGNFRLGVSCGSDLDKFIGVIHVGYEHSYALKGGWELFFQLKEDVAICAKDLWRTGGAVGIKIPL